MLLSKRCFLIRTILIMLVVFSGHWLRCAQEDIALDPITDRAVDHFYDVYNKGFFLGKKLSMVVAMLTSCGHQDPELTAINENLRTLQQRLDGVEDIVDDFCGWYVKSRDQIIDTLSCASIIEGYTAQAFQINEGHNDIKKYLFSRYGQNTLGMLLKSAAVEHCLRLASLPSLALGHPCDLIVLAIGARGYRNQELPPFIKSLDPAIQVLILSASYDWEKKSLVINDEAGNAQKLDLSTANLQVPSQWQFERVSKLSTLNELIRPVRFSTLPNRSVTLVDLPIKLGVMKNQYSHRETNESLEHLIQSMASLKRSLVIANYSNGFDVRSIPLIAGLYRKYIAQREYQNRLALYTRGNSCPQVIVYNPQLTGWQGASFQDPLGKHFINGKPGFPVVAFSNKSFNDGSFAYRLQKDAIEGTRIVGMSGNDPQQPVLP